MYTGSSDASATFLTSNNPSSGPSDALLIFSILLPFKKLLLLRIELISLPDFNFVVAAFGLVYPQYLQVSTPDTDSYTQLSAFGVPTVFLHLKQYSYIS